MRNINRTIQESTPEAYVHSSHEGFASVRQNKTLRGFFLAFFTEQGGTPKCAE